MLSESLETAYARHDTLLDTVTLDNRASIPIQREQVEYTPPLSPSLTHEWSTELKMQRTSLHANAESKVALEKLERLLTTHPSKEQMLLCVLGGFIGGLVCHD